MKEYKFTWEFLNTCPICDHDVAVPNGKISYLKQDFWYVVCVQCNTKYMNPRPTKSSYDEFYENYFWEEVFANNRFRIEGQIWNYESKGLEKEYQWKNEKVNRDTVVGEKEMKEKLERLRIKDIENILTYNLNISNKTSILEVGAGIGVTLNHFQNKYNSKVYAIEPSNEARRIMSENNNIKIIGKFAEELENLSLKKENYDCIIFAHSLENTLNPVKNILDAANILNKNGCILVQCSNLFTFDQMNPYHPFIFSFQSFKYFKNKKNFSIKRFGKETDRMLNVVIKND